MVFNLQVAVVRRVVELHVRVGQGREREWLAALCCNLPSVALAVCQRKFCHLFVVAAVLRTRIVDILLVDS